MKPAGETIKEIRIMKNLRQQDFTELSQAAIASIESKKRNITIDKLQSILNDFNMSLREFEYIRNDYSFFPTDKIFFEFTSIKNSIERKAGSKLIKEMETHLEKNPTDFIIYCMYVIEDVFLKISEKNSYNIESPESFQIWSTLYNRPKWTYQEIFIMSKLFYVYPFEIATKVIRRIEKEMAKYLDFLKEINFDCTFYLNVGKFFIHNKELILAKSYLSKVLPLCKKHDKIILEIDAEAHLAIISHLNGDKNAHLLVADKIDLYKRLNRPNLAHDLETDWNTFFKNKNYHF